MSNKLEKAIQAVYAGNLSEAEVLLTQVISEEPINADAYFYRGKVRWQKGNLAPAINDFEKVLQIDPLHNQAKISIEMVKQILGFRNPDLYNP